MREMTVKADFYPHEREDIHDRARCQFSNRGAVSPRETSGGQNAYKRKRNGGDRCQVGTGP